MALGRGLASTVVIPFKDEDPGVLERTIGIAARHPSVQRVVAVGYSPDGLGIAEQASAHLAEVTSTPVQVLAQRRIGSFRSGKGDGMLTGLEVALDDPSTHRIHFYDADIRTFSSGWIDRAESALDEGFDVARHFFDRASTDAQITWHITRAGFALLWPETVLPEIEQPLGGELALTRSAAGRLLGDERVRARSDWGIDTTLTVAMATHGMRIAEVFVPDGKLHGLYAGLDDLRAMATECFATIQWLRDTDVPDPLPDGHRVDALGPPPETITSKAAFDLEASLPLLTDGWTDRERALAASLPEPLAAGFRRMAGFPSWSFLDDPNWRTFLLVALADYDHDDADWQSLFFRGWTARTIRHTTRFAVRGYEPAMSELRSTVARFRSQGSLQDT